MARTQRLIRLATALAFILLLLANGQTKADATGANKSDAGIQATYFTISEIPPAKDPAQQITCGSEIENNINRNFEGEPFIGCPDDLFMVHYTGFITLPQHNTIQFWLAADDGGTMNIGGVEWGDWTDKGCTALETEPMTLQAEQPLMLDGWFYENGGSTCFMLAWNINNEGWQIVPDSAFTLSVPQTTTSTTQPAPTTTEPSAPTTTSSSIPETQTTHHQDRQTTDTTVASVPVQTLVPIAPVTTLPATVPVSTSLAPVSTDAPTTTQPMPTTTLPLQEPTLVAPSTTTPILELLNNPTINADEATALATSSAVLEQVTPEQAQEIFQALEIDTLEPSEITALVETVQDAPVEIREAFEEAINVFDGAVDTYVPIGSTVPISTRRLVIAAGAMLAAVPTTSRRK